MHHDERQSRTVTAPASPFLHGTMGRSHGGDHHPDACVRGTGHKEDSHGESLHFPSAVFSVAAVSYVLYTPVATSAALTDLYLQQELLILVGFSFNPFLFQIIL